MGQAQLGKLPPQRPIEGLQSPQIQQTKHERASHADGMVQWPSVCSRLLRHHVINHSSMQDMYWTQHNSKQLPLHIQWTCLERVKISGMILCDLS